MYPNHPSTTMPLTSKPEYPTIKLTLKTEPVLYNISFKDETSMRNQNKVNHKQRNSNCNGFKPGIRKIIN